MNGDTGKKLWWAWPAGVVLVLVLLSLLAGGPPVPPQPGSTYDAGPEGVRAAFLLLEGLGFDVRASKRIAQGRTRWVLFPRPGREDLSVLADWVRSGGRLLLAEEDMKVATALGVTADSVLQDDATENVVIEGAALRLAGGKIHVTPRARPDRTWPADSPHPLAGIFRRGLGEVWLLYRPAFLRNDQLREADNAVVLCRLAEAFGEGERIYFDEFFHGMRDRPGPAELLLQPPALEVTLQALVLLALLLWHFLPRFGVVEDPAGARRRSKEEYVDALASLLEQKRAYPEGFRAVRDALARELEHAFDLPAGTPAEVLAARAAAANPGLDVQKLTLALSRPGLPRSDAPTFLQSLHELERLRREVLHERYDR